MCFKYVRNVPIYIFWRPSQLPLDVEFRKTLKRRFFKEQFVRLMPNLQVSWAQRRAYSFGTKHTTRFISGRVESRKTRVFLMASRCAKFRAWFFHLNLIFSHFFVPIRISGNTQTRVCLFLVRRSYAKLHVSKFI